MKTKTGRVLDMLKEQRKSALSARDIFRMFNERYADGISRNGLSKILSRVVRHACLRTPTQLSSGYYYTFDDPLVIKRVYKVHLFPYDHKEKETILRLIRNTQFPILEERCANVENAEYFAEVLGFGMGDGHFSANSNYFCFFFPSSENAMVFSRRLNEHFGIATTPFYSAQCYRMALSDKKLHMLFRSLGMPLGNKVKTEFLVPDWVFHGENSVKRAFLRGFFGAEGSRPFKGRARIQLVLSKEKRAVINLVMFMNQIRSMLNHFNISSTHVQVRKQEGRNFYARFYVTGKENVLTFYSKVGFVFALEKQQELGYLVQKFKNGT